jgi:hypothetical protein
MRYRQQLTPSSSSSASNGSDIESYFNTGDKQEKTNAETEPTDINTDIDGDDEADLPDLEWLACKDNTNTVLIDINTDINRDNKADLVWITREENTHLPEYYLNQENNSNESENKDKNYSNSSLFLLNIIER